MPALLKTCAASLLLAASFAALAADDDTPVSAVSSAAGQIAVRDAATGALRAPTPAEVKALRAAGPEVLRAAVKAQPATLAKHHHTGATGARLNDNFMSYSVVVKQADGKLAEYCFDDLDAAEAAVAAPPAPVSQSLPTE